MSDPDDLEALAAEYALGTLDRAEREQANARRAADPGFDAAILSWEARLAPLADSIPELAPPTGLFAQIQRRLDAGPEAANPVTDLALRRRLKNWRIGALAASALAACLALALGLREVAPRPPSLTYVARLEKNAASPGFLLTLDPARRTLAVRPIDAALQKGKSYELWLVAPKAAPRSLGLLDTVNTSLRKIPSDLRTAETATWAVSLEPAGGSPTGAPTGPILFTGKFAAIRS